MFFRRKKEMKIPNENYKKQSELTKEDFTMIDMDRQNTGIAQWDDEYYYNFILNHNYDLVEY